MDLDETEDDGAALPPPPPTVPVLDQHDAAAVLALLIRTIRIDDELKRDRQTAEEANARIAANTLARSKTIAAYTVFGFDTGEHLWDSVWTAIGDTEYRRAIALARGQELPTLLEQMDDPDEEAREEQSVDEARDRAVRGAPPKIKDAILDYLRALGESGATAREVRQHLADAYHLNVHEKTPGMTLYRLLKDGLVTRQGRTWYPSIADNKENEAPAARPLSASEAGGVAAPSNHQPEQADW